MAYFYKVSTQQVQSESEIRAEFPNTSFPVPFYAPEGYEPILESPAPETTPYQSAFQDGVVQDSLGNYVRAWKVVDWDQEQIDAYDAQQKDINKALAMNLLSDTDWTQMPDVYLINKGDFTDYRTALRTIALNPPITVTEWPTKPDEQWTATTVVTPLSESVNGEA